MKSNLKHHKKLILAQFEQALDNVLQQEGLYTKFESIGAGASHTVNITCEVLYTSDEGKEFSIVSKPKLIIGAIPVEIDSDIKKE